MQPCKEKKGGGASLAEKAKAIRTCVSGLRLTAVEDYVLFGREQAPPRNGAPGSAYSGAGVMSAFAGLSTTAACQHGQFLLVRRASALCCQVASPL